MGQQLRTKTKRQRRKRWIERKKEAVRKAINKASKSK